MASKYIVVAIAQVLLVQAAFGQYIAPGSYVTGNSVVENDIYIGGGYSAGSAGYGASSAGYGIGSSSLGLGSSSYGLGSSSLGLGSSSLGLGSSSLGLGSASYGLGSASLGLGGIGVSGLGLAGSSVGSLSAGTVGLAGLSVAPGSPLLVTAISPIGPSGLAIASENVIEGNLLVTGQLPFLSAVAFEGALPTAGSGVATCGCGNGQVGITSEGFGRPQIYY